MATDFDIIVVGGGHAGIEAAWAASRLGARMALVTFERAAIGRMSCNPAIGGLGKGHMVREIDALGGLMGLAADRAGIQFRMLNSSKGAAVRAPRAQADRADYAAATQSLLAQATNLEIIEGSVEELVADASARDTRRIRGAVVEPRRRDGGSKRLELRSSAVILTTGTFLRGLMHCGTCKTAGGRVGEAAAVGISEALRRLGFELGRLKTGTPPRVHRDTLDYDRFQVQPGDEVPSPFSFMTDGLHQPQAPCWITYTCQRTHEIIRANLDRAPMYSGQIESTGPRYCPSIEDKVVRFADKPHHQIFLEPEGYDNERIYCNGISTSLPADVQEEMVHSIAGMEHARIVQYGYAVEYDWVPTHQTRSTLESKLIAGLYLAGQINGTSGYEEAAGQGLLAGVNAALALGGRPPLVLGREQAYLGVMIDDIITRPPIEPYRMFTSRAEYRLSLRADNADQRLTPIGRDLGLVDDARWLRYERKRDAIAAIERAVARTSISGMPLTAWVRRPDADVAALADALYLHDRTARSAADLEAVLVKARYRGYLDRQDAHVQRMRRLESTQIPVTLSYDRVPSLRAEARENLGRVQPRTLGQASRITGITPADIMILWVHINSVERRIRGNPAP
ncbi:MAG: tRNA uridine-5-carboxymethylaminomethyl(34) synthesis enzyme MnmG [Phycisphaerales bacterium]|nr:MAG: tRNA uridine-5-carboxymethylaminomethyl(34) synthesis enzyme MnmG [Phycisphaerales bacterium]